MKEIFEQMEAEVEQNVMDKQCADIERKNVLIENKNLIAACLSNELLYSVMNDVNTVSRFFEMHDAYTVEQAHCLELEDEISKLKHKIQKDDRSEMIKHFYNLKIYHLNLQLKYQNLKEQVNSSTEASGSKPRSNTKNTMILPAKSDNKKKVEDHPRNNKSNLKQKNRIDSSISFKRTIILWYLDSGCSKHMTRNRSRLKNFVKKFIGIVRFENDNFGAIMGYGDYVIGDNVISKVYYVEGLGHNLFSIGQFCDSDLAVAFRKHSCYVRDVDGVELIKGSRSLNLYTISIEDMMKSSPICLLSKASKKKSWLWHHLLNHLNFGTINYLARRDLVRVLPWLKFKKDHLCAACQLGRSKNVGIFHQKSIPRTPQQNDVVERQNHTLVEAARTMMIFSKDLMFLWVEAVATAFFGALCYPTNDSEDLGKLKATADVGIFVGYAPNRKEVQHPISHQGVATRPTIEDNPFAQSEDDPFLNVFAPEPSSKEPSSGDVKLQPLILTQVISTI
ncbi:integrase, catalytic region, zinc finger, CCHC-type containing protein [Tanacetum coccineum]